MKEEIIKPKLKDLYDKRDRHMIDLVNWKNIHPVTHAGMCASLTIIEAQIEILEELL